MNGEPLDFHLNAHNAKPCVCGHPSGQHANGYRKAGFKGGKCGHVGCPCKKYEHAKGQ